MNNQLVTCNDCGWVHFQVTHQYVEKWHADWVVYWQTLDGEGREAFGVEKGPPSRDQYYECFRCGGDYKNMRDSIDGDYPIGCTIQPILGREENG